MMPRSHLLFGFLAGAVVSLFVQDITLLHVLAAGVLAVLIDLDHFACHIFKTKDLHVTNIWKRCFNDHYKDHKEDPHYKSRFVHYWPGIIIISVLFAPLFWWRVDIAAIAYAGYYSHILSDNLTKLKFYGNLPPFTFEVRKLLYPVYIDELLFDVFVFAMTLILLLKGGLL